MRCSVALLLSLTYAAANDPDQCIDGHCSSDDVVPAVTLLQHGHAIQAHSESKPAASASKRKVLASHHTRAKRAAAKCNVYTSTVSPDGLAECPTDTMPYSYGYHLHVTYDSDSDDAAVLLMNAFMDEFVIDTCNSVEETGTLFSIDEPMCVIIPAVSSRRTLDICDTCVFPVKFMSIYLRAELLFDSTTYATSPWQWMALNKNTFGSDTDLDVFVHPLHRCPNAGHALWATFVMGDSSTAAAANVANAVDVWEASGNNGCYGLQLNGCDEYEVDGGTYLDDDGQCALSGIAGYPDTMTDMMATSYQNYLRLLNGGAYDTVTQTITGHSAYNASWPSTMWPNGCVGSCDVGQIS